MIQRREKKPVTVILSCTVDSVAGHRPSITQGRTDEEVNNNEFVVVKKEEEVVVQYQEAKLRAEKRQHSPPSEEEMSVQKAIAVMRQREQQSILERQNDVYSKDYVPRKIPRDSSEYGRPPPGSLTEIRAKKASRHIAREMLQLCEVIEEYGHKRGRNIESRIVISFGELFKLYQFISDKVVGMLLRARKHGMVDFEGEMLFQRQDEKKMITLLLNHEQITEALKEFEQ